LYQLPDAEFLATMEERYQPLPAVVRADRELLAHFLSILRADFTLFDTYQHRPGKPLSSPITAFGGEEDPQVSVDGLSRWSEQTLAAFRLRLFRGDHFYLRTRQADLLQALTEAIELPGSIGGGEKC
jgi:medium-chain acyl-[acyl-carrier-protein] hydrolase